MPKFSMIHAIAVELSIKTKPLYPCVAWVTIGFNTQAQAHLLENLITPPGGVEINPKVCIRSHRVVSPIEE